MTADVQKDFPRTASCVVSSRSPYRIISVSSDFTTFVDFSELELLGRSFAVLCGPETDIPIVHGAIKTVDTNPQKDVHVTLYGRTGDRRHCAASFAAALECNSYSIGCEVSVLRLDDPPATMPTAPPAPPTRFCQRSKDARSQLRNPGLDRRRHNLYVGLLLESEAKLAAKSNVLRAATRLEEEALLCQLLATVCV